MSIGFCLKRPHFQASENLNSKQSCCFAANLYIFVKRHLIYMEKTIIKTDQAPAPIGPYNQAIMANGMLFISGQIAIVPATGQLLQNTIEEEAKQVMLNLQAILKNAGMGFEHVVKTTIFLSDMALFTKINPIYGQFFSSNFPARETVAVKGLPLNANIEISMIAMK